MPQNISMISIREYRRGNQKGQSGETGNTGYTRQRKTQLICVGHHYSQANTNNENKTCILLQTIGNKYDLVLCGNRNGHRNTELGTQTTQITKEMAM